ncbi:palmitoleoyl-protein carboxylesterase NOTUM [Nematostella vectensis]|uniref:palmitoleoyl-protein carboxylesterase NOTUM n=1 Tax=Nematostella vectensis TaxID=45351 RepID=UPI0020774E52|nr:palmitoleoyl-protein carboxylesterase NOTUM [Nematostella vectensis]XP_048587606.1 palmitoleoyl-protein carboxylesterase NOTUM [Nematostella vectensis]XP_048587607.1 palmitoleoyl-protein carboxylesterase NOTUM [Nematostella vectensis]XP_048587608.1 palmitoleoyl-protein carboxylesterase NOTUM [Nematostella vectensis]
MRLLVISFCWIFVYTAQGWPSHGAQTDILRPNNPSKSDSYKEILYRKYTRKTRSVRPRKKYRYNLRKHEIRDARDRNALCLDGSPAVFYLSRNPYSKDWVIQLQAGGSCGDHKTCHERAKGSFGSSKDYELYMTGSFLSSDNPNENPTFASWNKVLVPYCSGDVFVGRKTKETHPYGLQMLGHFIVKAVVQQLMDDYKINTTGTLILFGGASAGGLGMLANVDFVQQMVLPAKVRGFNDGGWFTLFPNFGEENKLDLPYFFSTLGVMFSDLWDGFVDETCRAEMPKAAGCLYGELVFKYLSTPIYVMVAQWDSYQLQELVPSQFPKVRLPPELPSEAAYLAKFGNNTHRSLRRLIMSKMSGVFSPACFMHTFSGEAEILSVTSKYNIQGKTAYKAFSEWHVSGGAHGTYVERPLDTPFCNPSCCSSLCTKCREQEPTKTARHAVAYDPRTGNGSGASPCRGGMWLVVSACLLHIFTRWRISP